MEEIFERRSIRKYQSKKVESEKIDRLLEAAVSAPSAGNEQPWHFIVIKDIKRLNHLAEIHPYAKMLKEAPLAIAVCADLGQQKHQGFWVQDCSAATQNILLEAQSLGLGSVWIGCHPAEDREKKVSSYLKVPAGFKTLSLVAVGYPAEEKERVNRMNDEIVHLEEW